ncbi:MAG: AMP-binding protein [Candidatus Sabulitectum sp.]|nr:AMP-binding protein [Candidatus Sabulitectum sp.]
MNRVIPGGPLYQVPELPSIPDLVMNAARRFPDRIAVREPAELGKFKSINYRQFASNIDWVARGILETIKQPVVAVVGKNSISWYTAYLAVHRAGGVVVPIDPGLPQSDIHNILHYSGANMIFHDADFADWFDDSRDIVPVAMNAGFRDAPILFSSILRKGRTSKMDLPAGYDADMPAIISYTSGTTGLAKGVVHSQSSILANVRQILQFTEINENDIFLSVLPVHHLFEGTCGFLLPLAVGAEIAIAHGLRYVASDLVSTHATVLLAVPLLWETLYRRIMVNIKSSLTGKVKFGIGLAVSKVTEKLGIKGFRRKVFDPVHEKFGGKLRLLISGGAGIDPHALKGLEKLGFKMLEGYGLTETAPLVSANRLGANKYGSVGFLLSEVEGRIDEPDESGVGEIVVRGPNIMLGYHGNHEATAKVLSEDGWFHTGDFGYFDSEGYLFITGRKKNVIIAKNGENVYPEELETKLNRFDHIKECMVFGRVSETKGEETWVLLVPDRELLIEEADNQNRKITQDDEINAMKKAVKSYNSSAESFKRIASFIIYQNELPKTTTKKIKRNVALKEAGMSPSEVFKP